MAKNDTATARRYPIIWIGLVVGLGFYIVDILIDVLVFHSGTLKEEFLHPTYHETWMRSAVFIVAVAFSIYVQLLLRRERETSERAMTAERFLNSVVDNIPSMIFIKEAEELRFIRVNRTGENLLGITAEEMHGKTDYEFFTQSQAKFFTEKDRMVLESRVELDIPAEEIDTKSRGRRWLHTKKVPILNDAGEPIYLLGISEDITEAREIEDKLRRQQREMAHIMRLSTMGEMASSIAHELNQPLTALTSYCGTAAALVKSQESPQPQLSAVLERAEEQAHRAAQIIRHLRDFLSKADDHKECFALDQVIAGVIEFIQPEVANGGVKIDYHSGGDYKVIGSKVQIEQVLVNLLINSLEAMKESGQATGKISVQTRRLADNSVETIVTDNGPGIDADIAAKVFDPFQTTKPSGMGMGLSISRSIVEEHAGKLWADVQRPDGAMFAFSLPACE
jgi:PAS domain S-box-containing protein